MSEIVNNYKKSRGDTIVEVMIAMAVLAFILGASFVAANRSFKSGQDSTLRSQAITNAQQQIEALKVVAQKNPTLLASYEVSNKPFCINAATTTITDLSSTNPTCAAASGIGVVITYNTSTKAFTATSKWQSPSSNTTNQAYLQYKPVNSLVSAPSGAQSAPTVGGPAAINDPGITFNATPGTILPGNSSTLNWSTIYGITTTCSAASSNPNDGNWTGSGFSSQGSRPTSNLSQDTAYTISCSRGVGNTTPATSTTSVLVENVTLTSDNGSSSVPYGGSTLLHWNGNHVSSCTLNGAALSSVIGQQSTGTLTQNPTTFTIVCTGTAGQVSASLSIPVSGAPTITSFTSSGGTSSSSPIAYGSSTTLTWASANTSGCSSAQFTVPGNNQNGSTTVGPLTNSSYTYTLGCYNAANVWSVNATITVYVGPPPPTVTTLAATNITYSSATLNGTVNPNGSATTYYFNYNQSTNYTNATSSSSAGSGTSAVAATSGVSLNASTTYYFRLCAINGSGTTVCGANQSFTTGAAPPSSYPPSSYPPSSYPPSSYPPGSYPPADYPPSSYPPSSYPPSSYPPSSYCGLCCGYNSHTPAYPNFGSIYGLPKPVVAYMCM